MNFFKKCLWVLALGFSVQANASVISLAADGQWNEFNVDDFSSLSQGVEWVDLNNSNSPAFGSAVTYQFTIANGFKGLLSVVDAGVAGDRFALFNNGLSMGLTNDVTNSSEYSNNFESNLQSLTFSKGVFTLGAGSYNISGVLFSTLQPFNATNGALKLDVTPVPLPGTCSLLLSGLLILMFASYRKNRRV